MRVRVRVQDTPHTHHYEEREQPSLLRKAANLGRAVVQHVAAGLPLVPDVEKARRLSICETCDFFRGDRSCEKCGCNMDVKAGWAEQQCPLGFWTRGKA